VNKPTTKNRRTAAPTPTFAIDPEDGKVVAKVLLAAGKGVATLYAEDYGRLMAAGISPFWYLSGNGSGNAYVHYSEPLTGSDLTVARAILGAGAGQAVKHFDGETTNLRRSNLYIAKARYRTYARELAAHPMLTAAPPATTTMHHDDAIHDGMFGGVDRPDVKSHREPQGTLGCRLPRCRQGEEEVRG
jgi:hypothetical protein